MSTVWLVVLVVGAATVALKATGPVLLGSRTLPPAIADVVALLAPVLLAALVVTQTVGGDGELVFDAQARRSRAPVPSRSRRERPCQSWWWSRPPPPRSCASLPSGSSYGARKFLGEARPKRERRENRTVFRGGIASMRAKKGARWGFARLLPRPGIRTETAKGAPMGRVISFANQKGGVAKTTTTLNLGVALCRAGAAGCCSSTWTRRAT